MRVLLYAPVDLNLIDGSAIWCASVAQMLCHDPNTHVDVLLNAPLKRDLNVRPLLSEPRVRLLDSWAPGDCAPLTRLCDQIANRLTPEQVFERIERLHDDQPYHLLVLRGGPICRLVAAAPQLAARTWFYVTQHGADFETIDALARSNGRIACQTPLLQEFLEGMLGTSPSRYVPLPPMVPMLQCDSPRAGRIARRLCYVGKFDADYMIEETLASLSKLREHLPDIELVAAGDKFHDPQRTGEFRERVTQALESTPGVVWRGGLSRDEVGKLMTECDLGCCWRSARYDDSLELSTKALEYAAAGLPVLLNPSRVNRLVFGADYPLYVDSPESFASCARAALEDQELYQRASQLAFDTCSRYTFEQVNRQLQPHLKAYAPSTPRIAEIDRPRRIVFAGHDLKFCNEIIDHFRRRTDCQVRIDQWVSHTQHDQRRSEEALRWADVVWCEWCLGNAVWYSQRLRADQRLVIRLHRQEITTDYPHDVTWENVGGIVFIAPMVRETMEQRLGERVARIAHLIYNTFDCDVFDRPKQPGAEHRLGLLGYCPKLKNPLLAVEILQKLRTEDDRWKLILTGRPPQSYDWLWRRPEEREYYERFEAYIAQNGLERHLVRQDWTDDPASWYADIGYILSTSDLEGSHQAIAEGMAAGCIPIVRRWQGAESMYPNSLLFDTADDAARQIANCADDASRTEMAEGARREARSRFDRTVIMPQLEAVVLGEPSGQASAIAAAAAPKS